mmetsp:Transcript_42911/g.68847  ORF Transcript_42911/g.68847 Transcript_42911/m.68847 type:complete len:246 (+) Transcript_42911:844-1581(+)
MDQQLAHHHYRVHRDHCGGDQVRREARLFHQCVAGTDRVGRGKSDWMLVPNVCGCRSAVAGCCGGVGRRAHSVIHGDGGRRHHCRHLVFHHVVRVSAEASAGRHCLRRHPQPHRPRHDAQDLEAQQEGFHGALLYGGYDAADWHRLWRARRSDRQFAHVHLSIDGAYRAWTARQSGGQRAVRVCECGEGGANQTRYADTPLGRGALLWQQPVFQGSHQATDCRVSRRKTASWRGSARGLVLAALL